METGKAITNQYPMMARAINVRSIIPYILIIFGFSFAWYSLYETRFILDVDSPDMMSLSLWRVLLYLTYAVVFALCSGLIAHFQNSFRFIKVRNILLITTGCLYAVALTITTYITGFQSPSLALMLIVLTGCFSSFHFYAWSCQIVAIDPIKILLCLSLSAALTDIFAILNHFVLNILGCIFPLASFIFLLLLKWPHREHHATEWASIKRIPWYIVVICAVLIIAWLVVLSIIDQSEGNSMSTSDRVFLYSLSAVLSLMLAIYYSIIMHKHIRSINVLFLYPFIVLTLANIAVIGFVVAMQFNSFAIFKDLFVVVVHILDELMFLIIVYNISTKKLSHICMFTLYSLVLSSNPWGLFSRHFQEIGGIWSESLVNDTTLITFVAIGLSFITTIAIILVLLRFRSTHDLMIDTANGGDTNTQSIFYSIGMKYGLTNKEREVLQLLYRGYSSKHAAQELNVSDNTIRTHTTAIYRKLAVHSKQELIDFINDYRSNE